ncbi:MAG: response regulator transcription factor [Bacteroidales bacterium]|nr:response regulator transcription factor [Bacteroidales bacterium]
MSRLISLQIVESSEIIVEGLKAILEGEGFNILAPMSSAAMLRDRLPQVAPDILLVNPTLLGPQAAEMVAELQSMRPQMPIAALVYEYVPAEELQAYGGVVDIRMPRNKAAALLHGLIGDATAAEPLENYELSAREMDVLTLIAQGLSSKEIADRLCISIHTVNSHRKNITRKTGIKSVAGLAVYAMLHNLS